MIKKMFALYDEKGHMYGPPFFEVAVGVAVRNVVDAAKDPQCVFGKFPEDFTLYEVGAWNDVTAEMTGIVPPLNIGKVSQLVEPLKGLPLGEKAAR